MEINQEFVEHIFDKPKILGIIADVNQGKSMLIYNLIEQLSRFKSNIVTYGLRTDLPLKKIHSVEELESLRDSIIFADEFFSLFDLDDRRKARLIEQTLRLINHNNNIIVLAGTGENFKKFISNKLSGIFFKSVTLGDFINGSRVKNVCLNYKGYELGTTLLNIPINKTLYYDKSYTLLNVEYLKQYDTKLSNKPLLSQNVPRNVENVSEKNCVKNNVHQNVPRNVEETKCPIGVN